MAPASSLFQPSRALSVLSSARRASLLRPAMVSPSLLLTQARNAALLRVEKQVGRPKRLVCWIHGRVCGIQGFLCSIQRIMCAGFRAPCVFNSGAMCAEFRAVRLGPFPRCGPSRDESRGGGGPIFFLSCSGPAAKSCRATHGSRAEGGTGRVDSLPACCSVLFFCGDFHFRRSCGLTPCEGRQSSRSFRPWTLRSPRASPRSSTLKSTRTSLPVLCPARAWTFLNVPQTVHRICTLYCIAYGLYTAQCQLSPMSREESAL